MVVLLSADVFVQEHAGGTLPDLVPPCRYGGLRVAAVAEAVDARRVDAHAHGRGSGVHPVAPDIASESGPTLHDSAVSDRDHRGMRSDCGATREMARTLSRARRYHRGEPGMEQSDDCTALSGLREPVCRRTAKRL